MKTGYNLRMSIAVCLLTCIFNMPLVFGAEPNKNTEDLKEPPVELLLEHAGKTEPIKVGAELNLERDGVKISFVIRENPYKRLTKENVSFLYPKDYVYRVDTSNEDFTIFYVCGRRTMVGLTRYKLKYPLDSILPSLEKGILHGRDAARREESKLEIQEGKLTGLKFSFLHRGEKLEQAYYAFNTMEHSYALMIQDVPEKDGKCSEETERMLRLLKDSFKFQEKKEK